MSSCFCWERPAAPGYSHVSGEVKERDYVCRWKCCLLSTCGCIVFVVAVLCIVIFAGIVPAMAQASADNSKMIMKSVHISNPTASSIQMDTVIELVNAGSNEATIGSTTATMSSANGTIGEMDLPDIHVKANKGATITTSGTLRVTNRDVFQQSVKLLLAGTDVEWTMTANTKVHAKLPGGFKQTVSVKMKKTMILPGGRVENTVSAGFAITKVTENTLTGKATISFVKLGILSMEMKNVSFHLFDGDIMIGYANLSTMNIQTGFNEMSDGTTTLVKNAKNSASLSRFFSRFLAGNDTNLTMRGPYFNSSSVIDGCLVQHVTNRGSTKPPSAIAGLETSTSMNGWFNKTDTTKYVRGGFSNMRNDLNVPLRLLNLSVHLYLAKPFGYTVYMGDFGTRTVVCNKSNHLSRLFIGSGMNNSDWNQTSLDIPAHSKKSFFAIGEPIEVKSWPDGSMNWFCQLQMGYDCCFSSIVTASSCRVNRAMAADGTALFEQDFIDTHLYSNMTVALDNKFVIDLYYYQDFFPVFSSLEIYQGFQINAAGGQIPTPNCTGITQYVE